MENPLVAVITSSAVESRVRKRGFRSISQLLQPFATHSVSVRDPSTGQLVSANVTIDFNDLNKEGHLLTLSVLPHVLFEVLRSKSHLNDALDSFEAALRKWAEPAEQETFRTYLACIFVVAGGEEKPMSELSRLVQEQHAQQHSSGDSKGLTPSHCGPPRWTTPNTLKHYFLLHDAAEDDEARTTAVFNEMCSTYGMDYCQMLRIGDGVVSEDLPDVWRDSDELDAILNAGLRRALQHAAASAIAHQTLERKPSATSVSTISPSYAVVQSSCIPSTALNGYPGNGKSLSIGEHAISAADREALKNVTLRFLKNCLIPHVERLMRTLLEQLAARRGLIGKSLTSGMKKWFGGTSTGNLQTLSSVSFQPESVEMQSRRLADLAFLFGLYSFAHSHYRSVKKDFEHSQAWLYHAAASEMAAVALYLSDNKVSPKQFPKHYFDAALENQLTYSGKYTCVVRCALNASLVLSKLSMFKEAATLLSTASSLDNDMCVAVTQAHASRNFEEAKMTRKAAFYRILAGNRFMKAGLKQNALECYSRALQKYANTNWDSIEDHLSTVLSADTSDKSLAVACAIRLLRESAIQTETNHAAFLGNFVETLTRFGVSSETDPLALPVPLLDVQATRVICGERPQSDDVPLNKNIAWIDIERAAYHTLAGTSAAFRPTHLVSDDDTDNQRVRSTPPYERFRVEVHLRNPLKTSLTVQNMRLGIKEVQMKEGSEGMQPFDGQELLPTLTFLPEESKKIELWVRPTCHLFGFRVGSLLLHILGSNGSAISGSLPMNVRGKRLNKNAKQMKSVVHAVDERLRIHVAQKQWPLLDFRIARKNQPQVFCGQAVTLNVEIENIGKELVNALCLATDGLDCVSVSLVDVHGKKTLVKSSHSPTNSALLTFELEGVYIPVREKIWLSVTVRAPALPGEESDIGLVFYYRGENLTYRQWQTVVSLRPVPLFESSAVLLDEIHGIVAINMRNVMPANDAALARCEVLRIRLVSQNINDKGCWAEVDNANVSIQPMRVGSQVQLDCEQSCNACIRISVPSGVKTEDYGVDGVSWWLSPMSVDPPSWPAALPNVSRTVEDSQHPFDNYYQLAIFWKASVVDNDGHVSSIVGETFIDEPLTAAKLRFPTTDMWSLKGDSFLRDGQSHSQEPPLNIICRPIKPIRHNFELNRLCQIPLEVLVTNVDHGKRSADLTLRYKPKVTEAVTSLSQLPPENRQQWWIDRELVRSVIKYGESHVFRFVISVCQPSVYDVAGSQLVLEAVFDDGEVKVFKVPNALAIVSSS
ncbi:hypothetical protein V3C99_005100 [Haemonchus contortus]|uniref:Trafficking protein particle complex subunit 8 n=1 Tax=Haemonchus contortus TaxID=6289 RepID=A0A7I4XU00_HAECO